jgi:26S proteasome regulatory subunit N5
LKRRENEGNITEAAELMQEVQVETYGSMDKEEKVDYILEQVRLVVCASQHTSSHNSRVASRLDYFSPFWTRM